MLATQRLIHDDAEAFVREVIDDRQRTKATPVEESVADEVHAPQIVDRECLLPWLPASATATSSDPTVPQRQTFSLVQTMDALVIIAPPFSPKDDEHPLTSVVNPARRNLTDSHPQGTAISCLGDIGER
ncbi:hypothetical protein GCM10028794_19870 [Silanimonas algicola]